MLTLLHLLQGARKTSGPARALAARGGWGGVGVWAWGSYDVRWCGYVAWADWIVWGLSGVYVGGRLGVQGSRGVWE